MSAAAKDHKSDPKATPLEAQITQLEADARLSLQGIPSLEQKLANAQKELKAWEQKNPDYQSNQDQLTKKQQSLEEAERNYTYYEERVEAEKSNRRVYQSLYASQSEIDMNAAAAEMKALAEEISAHELNLSKIDPQNKRKALVASVTNAQAQLASAEAKLQKITSDIAKLKLDGLRDENYTPFKFNEMANELGKYREQLRTLIMTKIDQLKKPELKDFPTLVKDSGQPVDSFLFADGYIGGSFFKKANNVVFSGYFDSEIKDALERIAVLNQLIVCLDKDRLEQDAKGAPVPGTFIEPKTRLAEFKAMLNAPALAGKNNREYLCSHRGEDLSNLSKLSFLGGLAKLKTTRGVEAFKKVDAILKETEKLLQPAASAAAKK